MISKFRSIALFMVLLAVSGSAYAQKATFEIDAPNVVAVGEVFRVEFTANTEPRNFLQPAFEGIDILAGPTSSTSRSMTIIDGSMEVKEKYTYTYVLQCNTEGEFTITSAGIEVARETIQTRPHTIKAIREGDGSAQGGGHTSQPAAGAGASSSQDSGPKIGAEDMFLRAYIDKKSVFKGEPVKVTFKLYSRIDRFGVESGKAPAFNGFWTQQLNVGQGNQQRETYNNKIYNTRVISEYLLFPQMAGTLTIDPMEVNAIAQIITQPQRRSILEDFFGGPEIQEVRRRVTTQPIQIKVNELPSGAPESFSGAVGEFEMSQQLPPQEIAANSAATYNVKISGNGNLPQIQAPKLSVPASFEQYNVKTTESINNTAYGVTGYRQFEYPVIARVVGEYDIAPVEFSYFNPRTAQYVTLKTPALTMTVLPDSTGTRGTPGMVSGLSKEDIKILGQDIRFIKLGSPALHPKGKFFMGSPLYFVFMLVIVGVFVFLLVWLRKYLEERRNSAIVKGKRANKVALLRFRAAEEYMQQDNQRGFYEEMLKALWGYMSDKLNIPVANLTKENVREELIKKGVQPAAAERYINIIGECEYAQYAPAASGRMNETYKEGVEIVSKFESLIGR